MLTGLDPFSYYSYNQLEANMINFIQFYQSFKIIDLPPNMGENLNFSDEACDLVRKLLQTDPNQRIQSI